MKVVEIDYDPYKMKTKMKIDGIDVQKSGGHDRFRRMIERNTPLQIWIESVAYQDDWKGLVDELIPEGQNDEVKIVFSGRDIDYQDLQRTVKAQNDARKVEPPATFTFERKKRRDDKVLAENIDYIVKQLNTEKFRALVQERNSEDLQKKYDELNDNYRKAKDTEFDIVFTGLYSAGKSTILNVLMRHTVLPTSDMTTTTKNCRICHNAELGSKIAMMAYDKDGYLVVPRQEFDNDEDCAALFLTICPVGKSPDQPYAAVDEIQLEADLSHLYPDGVSADKFKIVLIDTPGMNSAQSSNDGVNAHEQIALDAIGMETKPMVVLCVGAKENESKDIGEFMQVITSQSKRDKGGFNDRFLFLMNKSDEPTYRNGESLDGLTEKFANYLTDSTKWGKKETNEIEQAANFVPRIFPVSALMEWAARDGASDYSREVLKNDKWKSAVSDLYDIFKKRAKNECDDYCLARHCYGIPAYRREEVEKEFQQALDAGDYERAAQLQSGMCCVEIAIRDYIARYAYPIKVRALLETFEDILEDVNSVNQQYFKKLQEAQKQLGEKSAEREEAQEQKRELEQKRVLIETAEKSVEENKKKLAQLRFDSDSLDKAIVEFNLEIDNNSAIVEFRDSARNGYTISTGQRGADEVTREIKQKMGSITASYDQALSKTNVELQELQAEYEIQLKQIFNVLKTTIDTLKKANAFEANGYDFTKTVAWRTNFEGLNLDRFAGQVQKTVKKKTTEMKRRNNDRKDDWRYSWNPFKKFFSLFMSDTVLKPVPVDGSYNVESIVQAINEYQNRLWLEQDEMMETARRFLKESKDKVNALTDELLRELNEFIREIQKREKQVAALSGDLKKLDEEIRVHQETCAWLNALQKRLQEETV